MDWPEPKFAPDLASAPPLPAREEYVERTGGRRRPAPGGGSGNPCETAEAPRGIPSYNATRPLERGDLLPRQLVVLEQAIEFVETLVDAVAPGVTHEAVHDVGTAWMVERGYPPHNVEIVMGTPETGGIAHEEIIIVHPDHNEVLTTGCPQRWW